MKISDIDGRLHHCVCVTLSIWHALLHLNLSIAIWAGHYCHLHFTDRSFVIWSLFLWPYILCFLSPSPSDLKYTRLVLDVGFLDLLFPLPGTLSLDVCRACALTSLRFRSWLKCHLLREAFLEMLSISSLLTIDWIFIVCFFKWTHIP